jgi:DNA-binding transcriptional LysR family regulator
MAGHFERIRVFLEVAERQSFAAAARALGFTRSQTTRYVSELEAEMGVRLLTRTTRQVSLSRGTALSRSCEVDRRGASLAPRSSSASSSRR